MTRHCSVKDFFRQTPNALLARSFAARGLFPGRDFDAMSEGRRHSAMDAYDVCVDWGARGLEFESRRPGQSE